MNTQLYVLGDLFNEKKKKMELRTDKYPYDHAVSDQRKWFLFFLVRFLRVGWIRGRRIREAVACLYRVSKGQQAGSWAFRLCAQPGESSNSGKMYNNPADWLSLKFTTGAVAAVDSGYCRYRQSRHNCAVYDNRRRNISLRATTFLQKLSLKAPEFLFSPAF